MKSNNSIDLNKMKHALFVGVMSCIIQVINHLIINRYEDFPSGGYIYISFIVWGTYSLMKCSKNKSVKLLINFLIGFAVAYVMIVVGSFLPENLNTPIVALIIVPVIMYLDMLPQGINEIPVFFIGAGIYFSIQNKPFSNNDAIFMVGLVYVLIGIGAAKICELYSERILNGTS